MASITPGQCSDFTGMILVFGAFLILLGVVWYSGMKSGMVNTLILCRIDTLILLGHLEGNEASGG